MFYLDVRYEGDDGNPDLELIDDVNTDERTISRVKGYFGRLSTLLQWNRLDPVDAFEQNRNNIIYKYQHNRNPFIDHPEFASCIWDRNEDQNICSCIKVYPNPASDFLNIEWLKSEPLICQLYSVTGAWILEFQLNGTVRLPVNNLAAGMYILKVYGEDIDYRGKVIVNR